MPEQFTYEGVTLDEDTDIEDETLYKDIVKTVAPVSREVAIARRDETLKAIKLAEQTENDRNASIREALGELTLDDMMGAVYGEAFKDAVLPQSAQSTKFKDLKWKITTKMVPEEKVEFYEDEGGNQVSRVVTTEELRGFFEFDDETLIDTIMVNDGLTREEAEKAIREQEVRVPLGELIDVEEAKRSLEEALQRYHEAEAESMWKNAPMQEALENKANAAISTDGDTMNPYTKPLLGE